MRKRHYALGALLLAGLVCLSGCKVVYEKDFEKNHEKDNEKETQTNVEETKSPEVVEDGSLVIRYSNESFTKYLQLCKKEFEQQHEGTTIVLDMEEKENYLVNISKESANGNAPDLYLINNEELATAYLAGLAEKITADEFVTTNYDEKAVLACSYNDTLVAYPLSYKTTFLAYNSAYVTSGKKFTFDDIKVYSDNSNYTEPDVAISRVFNCNVSDLFLTYGFLGNDSELGGKTGCDSEDFEICNQTTINSMKLYNDLISYFSLDSKQKYKDIVKELTNGTCVFSIIKSDSLKELEKCGIEFVFEPFPDYDSKKKTTPLSITSAIVINPYSTKSSFAHSFAEFVIGDMSEQIFKYTKQLPTNKNASLNTGKYEGVYHSYLKSVSKNKLQFGDQVYPLIEIAMHNIIAGSEIEDELKNVDEYMKKQIN